MSPNSSSYKNVLVSESSNFLTPVSAIKKSMKFCRFVSISNMKNATTHIIRILSDEYFLTMDRETNNRPNNRTLSTIVLDSDTVLNKNPSPSNITAYNRYFFSISVNAKKGNTDA